MKFAKELQNECIPEWRAKYLNYKLAKKKLKAVARARRNINLHTTHHSRRRPVRFSPTPQHSYDPAPTYAFLNRSKSRGSHSTADEQGQSLRSQLLPRPAIPISEGEENNDTRVAPNGSSHSIPEEQPLRGGENRPAESGGYRLTRYGSIIGSPPRGSEDSSKKPKPPSLSLPDPALTPEIKRKHDGPPKTPSPKEQQAKNFGALSAASDAYEIGQTQTPQPSKALAPRHRSLFHPKRINSTPGIAEGRRPFIKRMFSLKPDAKSPAGAGDTDLQVEAKREYDIRQAEFFNFLDMELEKIEAFYKEKEDEATQRLKVLREQLHILRDRRVEELIAARASKIKARRAAGDEENSGGTPDSDEDPFTSNAGVISSLTKQSWYKRVDHALESAKVARFGKNTKALPGLVTPTGPQAIDQLRDYTRRPLKHDIPYRTAKRKLKTALQEFYRGLELLKSYALLNRTAFRKINKKYDKTVNARPPYRYVNEKVKSAWFVQSDVIEGHIHAVEDLYARYFEQGNHKIAVGKLRAKVARAGEYTASSFRNGCMLTAGLVFGIQGLVYGAELLFSPDRALATQTSFLLQIYAGYFLMLYLMLLFCLACRFWTISKINYVFIFEYDTRHHLDWRQLAELPCFFVFLEGLFLWIQFRRFGPEVMYIYWPVVLIGLTLLIICFPAKHIYHRSRLWLLYSEWRLFFAGLYPVEFRDFFLGDMFCSLTYSMGNIELFFCLYARQFDQPAICNSSHSRLLGFFATLPGIWRALQCIRRYKDTRNVFPHLVNCGKYTWTILYYMSLSLYRVDKTMQLRAFFIMCATVNSIYCSVWDLVMDWSLLDPDSKHFLLRDRLGYKQVWIYYAAMFIDPILRFNWIFYAIFGHDVQHSALLSFFVAFSEVCRRGMWSLFRVENEHCTNVGRFRAMRDIPLPYELLRSESSARKSAEERATQDTAPVAPVTPSSTGVDLEQARTRESEPSIRRLATLRGTPMMRAMTNVGTLMRTAHVQDFQRRRRPELGEDEVREEGDSDDEDSKSLLGDVDGEAAKASEVAEASGSGTDDAVKKLEQVERVDEQEEEVERRTELGEGGSGSNGAAL